MTAGKEGADQMAAPDPFEAIKERLDCPADVQFGLMRLSDIAGHETERRAELDRLGILDTVPDRGLDRITELAALSFQVPIALISLVDESRQWFKSRIGLDATETEKEIAFCRHAIIDDDVLVVPDAVADHRFRDNPLVTGDPSIRFYAGAPLTYRPGIRLGTLCVIDHVPRTFDGRDKAILAGLADVALDLIRNQYDEDGMREPDDLRDPDELRDRADGDAAAAPGEPGSI